jgi:hypothetical protein
LKIVQFEAEADHRAACVTLTLDNGEAVVFTISASTRFPDAINVEVDGDLSTDDPSLRVHLNDRLIVDTKGDDPAIEDPRRL